MEIIKAQDLEKSKEREQKIKELKQKVMDKIVKANKNNPKKGGGTFLAASPGAVRALTHSASFA